MYRKLVLDWHKIMGLCNSHYIKNNYYSLHVLARLLLKQARYDVFRETRHKLENNMATGKTFLWPSGHYRARPYMKSEKLESFLMEFKWKSRLLARKRSIEGRNQITLIIKHRYYTRTFTNFGKLPQQSYVQDSKITIQVFQRLYNIFLVFQTSLKYFSLISQNLKICFTCFLKGLKCFPQSFKGQWKTFFSDF